MYAQAAPNAGAKADTVIADQGQLQGVCVSRQAFHRNALQQFANERFFLF